MGNQVFKTLNIQEDVKAGVESRKTFEESLSSRLKKDLENYYGILNEGKLWMSRNTHRGFVWFGMKALQAAFFEIPFASVASEIRAYANANAHDDLVAFWLNIEQVTHICIGLPFESARYLSDCAQRLMPDDPELDYIPLPSGIPNTDYRTIATGFRRALKLFRARGGCMLKVDLGWVVGEADEIADLIRQGNEPISGEQIKTLTEQALLAGGMSKREVNKEMVLWESSQWFV